MMLNLGKVQFDIDLVDTDEVEESHLGLGQLLRSLLEVIFSLITLLGQAILTLIALGDDDV